MTLEVCCQFSNEVTALCLFETQNNAHGQLAVKLIKLNLEWNNFWQFS